MLAALARRPEPEFLRLERLQPERRRPEHLQLEHHRSSELASRSRAPALPERQPAACRALPARAARSPQKP